MIAGYVHDDFRAVADELDAQLSGAGAGGAAICIYHGGEPVVDIWAGTRNPAGDPWQSDTMAMSFSTTKGVAATLLHRLVDRRLIDYDDPVSRVWPEFAAQGKAAITVRDVLAHRAGLYAIQPLIDRVDRILDWGYMTERLAAAEPRPIRGGRPAYHALTHGWLVGEIIRRVTTLSFSEALQTLLAGPLQLDGAFLGAPETERGRVATLIAPAAPAALTSRSPQRFFIRALASVLGIDPTVGRAAFLPAGGRELLFADRIHDAEIPAVNGVFTARSLARMYAMLAANGELEGTCLLTAETVRRATKVQTNAVDAVIGLPMRWSLGYHGIVTRRGPLTKGFGHFGYGGSGAFADPSRNLALGMTLSRVSATPFGDVRMLRISGIAVRCADMRGARRRR